ncbi:MAG: single-stranded-DNA-specific exonuclease RecJ [Candidatus Magnetobacterium sp. LHC-1]|nr:single-stranded-DNA-specific exonuclease RecJ [Nitrospirota bacterium]
MQKRWIINRTNREFVDYLSKSAGISPIVAQIMINRGIKTPDKVNSFFSASLSALSDPYELPGMSVAVERIMSAINDGQHILVHGDYDADGTTATAILVETLLRLGGHVDYFIPTRFKHGYGFHTAAVEIARDNNAGLIITVDCGISSFEAVELANTCGIDVIITDHHEPLWKDKDTVGENGSAASAVLPAAFCIVNPKLTGVDNPLSILTGAGVSLKLSMALMAKGHNPDDFTTLLDIAAIGTIADVAPLIGDNRVIVKEGLRVLAEKKRIGLRALLELTGMSERALEPDLMSYSVIPRINAAGRMADATSVVKLMITSSVEEAETIARYLNNVNLERQRVEEYVLEMSLIQVRRKGFDKVITIADEGWHEGVLGIVASKMVDRYGLPAVVFSIKNGIARGSARSVPELDICDAISQCSECVIQFGGHRQAAGLTLKAEDIDRFETLINEHVKNTIANSNFTPTISIDADVALKDVNAKLLTELSRLAPYGYGNPEPILGSKGLMALNPRIVGKNHLKLRLGYNGYIIDAIAYDLGGYLHELSMHERFDAAFTPTINSYNGIRSVQLNVKAFRPSD